MLGRAKLRKRLLRLPDDVKRRLRAEFAQGADDIVNMMKAVAPVDDGELRESITWRWSGEGKIAYSQGDSSGQPGDMSIRISAGNTRVRYPHLVEFGAAPHIAGGIFKGAMHPGQPPQPFFFPSYRAQKKRVVKNFRRGIKRAMQDSAKG